MKLPLLFHIIIFWVVAVVVNLIFKSLFGFINYKESYGFISILVFSFDFIFVYLLHKRLSFSILLSILIFISILSIFIFMFFVWKTGQRESLLAQFLFLFLNLVILLVLLINFWNKFKFEYLNHILIILFFSFFSTILFYVLFYIFSLKNAPKPLFKNILIKQIAFIVPYPFIYKISDNIMIFLEKNFTTPTERIVIPEDKQNKNGGA